MEAGEVIESTTPHLDRFIAAVSDEERLGLGLEVLQAALHEARDAGLTGWAVEVAEYEWAAETGAEVNRPL